MLHNVIAGDCAGPLYSVNGAPAWWPGCRLPKRSGPVTAVDLAVAAGPAAAVLDMLADCGRRGVGAARMVFSSGFGETGVDGAAREPQLLGIAKRLRIRLVGPELPGGGMHRRGRPAERDIQRRAPGGRSSRGRLPVRCPGHRAPGRDAVAAALGVSGFVSLGNKLDVSGNDMLLYCEDARVRRLVALYLD
jgi:acyl-CoA synthetase (NDP forming)